MTFRKACRFLLLPSLSTAIAVLVVSWLFRVLTEALSIELNQGILLGWIPVLLGTLGYFLVIHHRLRLFFSKIHDKNYLFSLLAIAFLAFPGVSFQIAYENFKLKVEETDDLTKINPAKKTIVWKYTGISPKESQIYISNFQEYTSGKHPSTDFMTYALVHLKKENRWIVVSESERIDNDESGAKQYDLETKVYNRCLYRAEQLFFDPHHETEYLIPLVESEDLAYARQTLTDVGYERPFPKHFFELKTSFESGLKQEHAWLLIIAFGLNLVYFLVFCLLSKKVSLSQAESVGIFDLYGIQLMLDYLKKIPVTSSILLITSVFLLVEISHDPNILVIKQEPYMLRWTISNAVAETGEWYRLLTYPFTNYQLIFRVFDILFFALCAYYVEQRASAGGMIVLSICAQVAGGVAAIYFSSHINCGLSIFTFAYAGSYLFAGFQKRIGFSNWRYIGISLLVFILVIGTGSGFLDSPKLIAATLVGFAFGPILKFKESLSQ